MGEIMVDPIWVQILLIMLIIVIILALVSAGLALYVIIDITRYMKRTGIK